MVTLSNGLVPALQSFVATDDAVQRVLSLLFVSLAVIAAVMVLLGARLVAEHRRGEFTMMRARGASLRQVAAVAFAGSAVVVVPAAAVAIAVGVLATPGPDSWLSWWLAGLIIVTALASPAVLAAWWQRARRDAAGAGAVNAAGARRRIMAARRWVFDAALVCAGRRGPGPAPAAGPAPARPAWTCSPAPRRCWWRYRSRVLVMRAYPPVLRQLTRLARRRRGVVMVVGFARGSAAARVGALPVFALVLAFTVIAFAAMARGAVARADVAASWQAAGADAVVTAPAAGPGITAGGAAPDHRGAGRPALRHGLGDPGDIGPGPGRCPVVVVDPRQYAALVAATPGAGVPGRGAGRRRRAGGGAPAGPGARAHLAGRPGHRGRAQRAVDRRSASCRSG